MMYAVYNMWVLADFSRAQASNTPVRVDLGSMVRKPIRPHTLGYHLPDFRKGDSQTRAVPCAGVGIAYYTWRFMVTTCSCNNWACNPAHTPPIWTYVGYSNDK